MLKSVNPRVVCGVKNREVRKELPIEKLFIHSGEERAPPPAPGSTGLSGTSQQAWKPTEQPQGMHVSAQAIAEGKHEFTFRKGEPTRKGELIFLSRDTQGIFPPTGQVIHKEAPMASRHVFTNKAEREQPKEAGARV